jgi:hypothetical protein
MFNQSTNTIMKKNQFTLLAITFISGIFFGISALSLISFTNAGPSPLPGTTVSKISVSDANTLFRAYYDKTAPINAVVKGFSITKEHLEALNNLSNENSALTGFRIYMGNDNNGNVGIVVGVNSAGSDVTTSIYRVAAGSSGPCPTICDASSPIISH